MNCPKCGAPLLPGAKFCTHCGTPITPNAAPGSPVPAQPDQPQQPDFSQAPETPQEPSSPPPPIPDYFYDPNAPAPGQPIQQDPNAASDSMNGSQPPYQDGFTGQYPQPAPKKKGLTWLWIALGAVVAVALIIVLFVFVLGGSKTVDLDKYITVTYDGVDTVGTATAAFDYDKFIKDNQGKIKFTKEAKKQARQFGYTDQDAADLLYQAYIDGYYYLDPSVHLTNGDKVTLTWQYSDADITDITDTVNVKLKYADKEFTVKDLPEAETFDPFDGLTVNWEGVDTAGSVSIDASNVPSEASDCEYTADKTSGLSNGDTVTITLTTWDGEDPTSMILEYYGKIPSTLTKEYTVEGLGEAKTFNPFDYVTITFSGDDGDGYVDSELDEDGLEALGIDYYDYDFETEYGSDDNGELKNGDTITVKFVSLDSEDTATWFAANRGLIPDPLSKEFTVSGLTTYLTKAADIQEADLTKLTDQGSSVISAANASDFSDSEKTNSITYAGNYLLSPKEGMDPWPHNILYLIYKVNVTNGKGTYDYYTYIEYDDVKLDDSKALVVDISNYSQCYHTIYLPQDEYSYYYDGYASLDDMYKELCSTQVDEYAIEDNSSK